MPCEYGIHGILSLPTVHTHTLALLPKGKQAGILLWGFGGEVRGDGQGGDGRCSLYGWELLLIPN